jgi:hypothetical protein
LQILSVEDAPEFPKQLKTVLDVDNDIEVPIDVSGQ